MTTKPSFDFLDGKRFNKRLGWKAVILLVPTTILLTLIMGGLIYSRSTAVLTEQTSDQIFTFSTQVQARLDDWLDNKHETLNSLNGNSSIDTMLEEIALLPSNSTAFRTKRTQILELLSTTLDTGGPALFDDYMIVTPQGEILVASNAAWERESIFEESFFEGVTSHGQTASVLVFSPLPFSSGSGSISHDVVLITSQPFLTSQGNLLGYVFGLSASPSIQNILEANSGFLPNNNLFLVNGKGAFAGITDLTVQDSLSLHTPNAAQENLVYAGLSEDPEAVEYTSSDGSNVFGMYAFYPRLNVGFVVEYPTQISLVNQSQSSNQTLLIIAGFSLLIGIFIYVASQRITSPLGELAKSIRQFSEGNWEARAAVKRNDEIGLLAHSFNSLTEELNNIYKSKDDQIIGESQEMVTASEVSTLATSSASLDDLLNKTVSLISERFDFLHASIFIIDPSKEIGKLRAATGSVGRNLISQEYQINITQGSPYHTVIINNQIKVADESEGDFLDLDLMPGAKAKALVPISIGNDVFGLLDVQSADPDSLTTNALDILQTMANQLASAVQNFRLLEGTEVDLQQVNELFKASQKISRAITEEDVYSAMVSGVQQTSFYAGFYIAEPNGLNLHQPSENKPFYSDQLPAVIPLSNRLTHMFFEESEPLLIKDVSNPLVSIRPELLEPAKALNCTETALLPIIIDNNFLGLLILASREIGKLTTNAIQPFLAFSNMAITGLEKVFALKNTEQTMANFNKINELSNTIGNETDPASLYPVIHNQIKNLLGEVDFYIALYDKASNHIQIPYLYEGSEALEIEPFPLGEGLTSIVVRTKKPLMLVEKTEERAAAMGAKIVGEPAKSWLGIPLIVAGEVIGVISVQDVDHEHRFNNDDLVLLTTLSSSIASSIRSANLIAESDRRAYQLQTVAEISKETSTTLDRGELLKYSLQLIQDRFNFYHASVFIIDHTGEYAVVQESTGEAGKRMIAEGHQLKIGSQSIIGYVTEQHEPLVVNDVTQDPTHRFNPLLPDTRAELGIPIMLGDTALGALDVQSTIPFAFSEDDIEVLQILADQLAIAITNADLFTETQEHLAQHRLIHHVTTVAASSTNIEDALSSAVQGLRVTLGDRISILTKDLKGNTLRVQAAAGYDNDVLGMRIKIGQGITGWAAEHGEAIIVNDVLEDPRYIPGIDSVRSEMAVPLIYRGELLGVLNIESDIVNAYDENDQDILGTLAGSLSAIMVNARLAERQRQLFDITSKIRQSVNMDTILETTANELTKALQTRKTRIQVGGSLAAPTLNPTPSPPAPSADMSSFGDGQEGEE
jgi:GAF domain-containing protein/HAMP domain-containing protein